MTTTKFPVFCRLRATRSESAGRIGAMTCQAINAWLEEPKKHRRSDISEAFREGGARDWISQLVTFWKLDDLSLAELSEQLGISMGQASRLRNHFSASIGILGQWAATQHSALPPPDRYRWSIHGMPAALQTTIWLDLISATRSNRTPLPPKLSEHEVFLLIILEASHLQDDWDTLTDRYEVDLHNAEDDEEFKQFINRFAAGYLRLAQQYPPAKRRYDCYFSQGQLNDSRWLLCRDIDNLIRKIVCFGSATWAVVDGLTPWLMGLACHEDEDNEAA